MPFPLPAMLFVFPTVFHQGLFLLETPPSLARMLY
jgi:hypothetical protein